MTPVQIKDLPTITAEDLVTLLNETPVGDKLRLVVEDSTLEENSLKQIDLKELVKALNKNYVDIWFTVRVVLGEETIEILTNVVDHNLNLYKDTSEEAVLYVSRNEEGVYAVTFNSEFKKAGFCVNVIPGGDVQYTYRAEYTTKDGLSSIALYAYDDGTLADVFDENTIIHVRGKLYTP